MIPVILESPYAGDVEKNVAYARQCMVHSIYMGEAPFASHLLYTQPGILDDRVPRERALGLNAGFAWGELAKKVVVYTRHGITPGMALGIKRAEERGIPVEYRDI